MKENPRTALAVINRYLRAVVRNSGPIIGESFEGAGIVVLMKGNVRGGTVGWRMAQAVESDTAIATARLLLKDQSPKANPSAWVLQVPKAERSGALALLGRRIGNTSAVQPSSRKSAAAGTHRTKQN